MAEHLIQFVESKPDFFKEQNSLIEIRHDVYKQSARHLIRDFKSELINAKRPFETEEYREYRERNRRKLTADAIIQFEGMLIKALKQTSFDYSKLPKLIKSELDRKPYKFMNTAIDLDTWIYKVLIPRSTLDPNAITIELPINEDNPFISPFNSVEDGGLDATDQLIIKTKIIPFDNWQIIKEGSHDFLIITMPEGYELTIKGETKSFDYFYLADDFDWYIYLPDSIDERTNEITYKLFYWYPHDYGSLPFAAMPGISAISKDMFYFQESFCKIYLEWADEFMVRFQDDQVVHTRFAYPREIVDPVKCTTCNGTGSVPATGFNKEPVKAPCKKCDGNGFINSGGINGRYIRSKDMVKNDTKEPVAFVSPEIGILAHTTPNAMYFLDEGRKSLGLNTLMPAQEAEETKKIREQHKIEILLNYAYSIIQWKEKHINQKLKLLDITGNEKYIILPLPLSIAIKGEEALKEEIDNSLPIDRFHTIKKYIQEKYNNDPVKQRIHILALLYAPFLGMNEQEINLRISQGSYNADDLIRADKAVYAFEQLIKEPGFMEDDEMMMIKAEEIVSKYFITQINFDSQ